jgi:DNA repair protein RecO (recombination protein O)
MRRLTSEALLLDVVGLHDRDRIVTLLTPWHGRKRGVARGARRKYSRFAGQLQLLARVEVEWFERDGRDLARIEGVQVLETAKHLHGDLEGILLASYLAEHMVVFAQESEASDSLYRLLATTLEALRHGVDRSLAARYYETWVLRLQGIFPPPRECPQCGRPLAEEAILPPSGEGLVCVECAGGGGMRIGRGALDLLLRSARQNLQAVGADPPPATVLREVEALCAAVRRRFLQQELRSYEVMQRTLQEVGSPAL